MIEGKNYVLINQIESTKKLNLFILGYKDIKIK